MRATSRLVRSLSKGLVADCFEHLGRARAQDWQEDSREEAGNTSGCREAGAKAKDKEMDSLFWWRRTAT